MNGLAMYASSNTPSNAPRSWRTAQRSRSENCRPKCLNEENRSERRSSQPSLTRTGVDSPSAGALQRQPKKDGRSAQHQHRDIVAKNEGIRLDRTLNRTHNLPSDKACA